MSERGLVRPENQDAIFLPPPGQEQGPWLFLVADGMGGPGGGDLASALAVRTIPPALAGRPAGTDWGQALGEAIAQAEAAILAAAQGRPELQGMGTTLTVLVLDGPRALVANLGDSRAYLWRAGRLRQVSVDHSLVQRLVEEGSLTPELARHHGLRNVLTRVLGAGPAARPDFFAEQTAPGDLWLLCSDGLHGLVEDEELARELAGPRRNLPALARRLVDLALERGGSDNISLVLAEAAGA